MEMEKNVPLNGLLSSWTKTVDRFSFTGNLFYKPIFRILKERISSNSVRECFERFTFLFRFNHVISIFTQWAK